MKKRFTTKSKLFKSALFRGQASSPYNNAGIHLLWIKRGTSCQLTSNVSAVDFRGFFLSVHVLMTTEHMLQDILMLVWFVNYSPMHSQCMYVRSHSQMLIEILVYGSLSFEHTLVLCQNGSTYCRTFCRPIAHSLYFF